MKQLISVLTVFLCLTLSPVFALEEVYPLKNDTQQNQFNHLLKELRCLVCQNQDLADSQATLALDLKKIVYEKVKKGESNSDIKQYLIERYGDFVTFSPPLNEKTYILWFLPIVFLLTALFLTIFRINRKKT